MISDVIEISALPSFEELLDRLFALEYKRGFTSEANRLKGEMLKQIEIMEKLPNKSTCTIADHIRGLYK